MAIYQQVGNLAGTQVTREGTRRVLAYVAVISYLVILAIIVLWGWLGAKKGVDDVVKVLTAVAGVLSGIVGAIVGFYFRSDE